MNKIEQKDFIQEYIEKGDYHFKLKSFQEWFIKWNYDLLLSPIKEKSDRILDLACGDGYLEFNHNDFTNIVGLDFSPDALRYAKQKNRNSLFICSDIRQLPLPDQKFDFVISSLSIQYLDHEGFSRTLTEVGRVLKRNGMFIFSYINTGHRLHKDYILKLEKKKKDLTAVLETSEIISLMRPHGFRMEKLVGTNIPFNYEAIPGKFQHMLFQLSKIGYFLPSFSYHHVYYVTLSGESRA